MRTGKRKYELSQVIDWRIEIAKARKLLLLLLYICVKERERGQIKYNCFIEEFFFFFFSSLATVII